MKKNRLIVNFLIFALLFVSSFKTWAISLADAQKEYLFGNYEQAIRAAVNLKPSDETMYFLGLVHIKIGEYNQGRKYFQKVLKLYPDSGLYASAILKIGDSYFLQKEYESALRQYQRVEEKHPKFPGMPLVLLRLAQISSRRGEWKKKNYYLGVIKEKYPDSSEMKFVKMLDSYGDFFTIQVGAFSERGNALALKNELVKKYKPYITIDDNGSLPIYKVRVGKYKSKFEVQKVSRSLQSQGYPTRIYP